jgi:light-regulated signal transduction histidine kinase (bacteriophytochrome)
MPVMTALRTLVNAERGRYLRQRTAQWGEQVQVQRDVSYLPRAALAPRSDLLRAVAELQARNDELARANAQLEEANAELLRSNDDLARFAVIASHDLAEPMRATAWFIQLLERHYGPDLDERAGQWMGYALAGLDEMTALVDSLLLYSRAGAPGSAQELVDTNAIVDEVVRVLHPAVEEAGATITVGTMPPVSGDPMQIRRLFQNLLTNAVKFRDGTRVPVINVSCERVDGEWRFAVTDNGIGIEPADHERVFRMFQRGARGDEFAGTGMGLAICERIVTGHGGRIWVEQARGGGSRVLFTLPVGHL